MGGDIVRIALIDDDRAQIEALSKMVTAELWKLGYLESNIDAFESGEAFLSNWQAGAYDVILLDIFMDTLTGVEIAHKIRQADHTVRLVFCTTSNEFASESYEVNAQYYLHKPVGPEGIAAMFRRLNLEALEKTKTVTLPDGHPVLIRRILYTDYCNHVVTLYIRDEEPYRVRISQTDLEALLLPYGYFFSPVKGIIINFYEVVKMTEEDFILSSGKVIHITRRKYRDAKDAYTRFRFDKIRREVET